MAAHRLVNLGFRSNIQHMIARMLLLAAVVAPVFAQDQDVTKYIEELRAKVRPLQDSKEVARQSLIAATKRLEAAADRKQKAWLNREIGQLENALGDSDAAVAAGRRAFELAPEDGRIAADLAYLLTANGQNAEASVVLGADATNGDALIRRAEQLTEQHEVDLAVACLRQAQRSLPADAATADTLGAIYLRASRPDDAIRLLDRAMLKARDNPLIHFRLAQAFAQKEYREYARAELSAALGCQPSPEVRAQIEDLLAKVTDSK